MKVWGLCIMDRQKYKFNVFLIKNLIGILLLGFIIGGCTSTQNKKPDEKKQESTKFYSLYSLNDINERSFAYYQYCLRETEPINKKFLENMKYTANQLLDVSVDKYGWTPEYVVRQVLKRRADIQQQLSEHYHTKGCHSLEGQESEENYRTVSKMTKKQIQ